MYKLSLSAALAGLLGLANAFPNLPFTTEGPNIVDSNGKVVKVAGTNWPGHNDAMIPEGLQYKSVKGVVGDIKSLGMNVIRLTYAIEMIDQIYESGGKDVTIETALSEALGETLGAQVLAKILEKNPQFTSQTTRLEVFDAVVDELNAQEIYVNLDNHISRGEWCCGGTDGNTWWGDQYFNADNWVRGLGYMAKHATKWNNLMSMSLRNELRQPQNNSTLLATYNWQNWYPNMQRGARAVHDANPRPLVVLSGLNYDTTMQPIVRGSALDPGSQTFVPEEFAPGYADKLVIELHNYQNSISSCPDLQGSLYNGGAQAMNPDDSSTKNVFPVLVTEFGFDQTDYQSVYSTCLASWLPDNTAGWMSWVIVGSYYMRQGTADYDETWGLYNHNWSAWRSEAYVKELLIPSIEQTLAGNS